MYLGTTPRWNGLLYPAIHYFFFPPKESSLSLTPKKRIKVPRLQSLIVSHFLSTHDGLDTIPDGEVKSAEHMRAVLLSASDAVT